MKASAYLRDSLDRACATGSRATEGLLHRLNLYPVLKTRYFDWPSSQDSTPWRIYFDDDCLISLTAVVSGGVTIDPSQFNLEPNNSGPPYDYIEIQRNSGSALASGATPQRSLGLTGLWGYRNDEDSVSTLTASLNSSATTISTAKPAGGVGSILRTDSERMLITERAWATSGMTVANVAGLIASATDTLLTVSDATVYTLDETLLIDSERLLVQDMVGTTGLLVKRSFDGSALAVHANGATVYRQLTSTVQRGALGTSAASHSSAAAVNRWRVPAPAGELSLAYAEDALLQSISGYARTVGSAEAERQISGGGIANIEKRAMAAMGRMARTRAV